METAVASILHVGLDVHKESIDIATADEGRDGELRHIGRIGGDPAALDKALRRLIASGHRLHVVYEAGPCGFVIWRHLSARGISCEVVPKAVTDIAWAAQLRLGHRPERERGAAAATGESSSTLLVQHACGPSHDTACTLISDPRAQAAPRRTLVLKVTNPRISA